MGIIIAPAGLSDMAAVMDTHGDGLIPTAPVLEFLRKEAGIPVVPLLSRATERRGEQARKSNRSSSGNKIIRQETGSPRSELTHAITPLEEIGGTYV